jgi:hypothetical protein
VSSQQQTRTGCPATHIVDIQQLIPLASPHYPALKTKKKSNLNATDVTFWKKKSQQWGLLVVKKKKKAGKGSM